MSEAWFREASGLPWILWAHDPGGRLVEVNPTFCEMFGVARERMLGDGWHTLVHPEDLGAYTTELRACLDDRRAFHAEVRARRPDGTWCWLESWARPRIAPGGAFEGLLGASADITDRKLLEASLRESEERLRLSAVAGHVGMFDLDPVASRYRWTERMRTICGLPPGAPVPDDIFEAGIVHPDDADELRTHMIAALDPRGGGTFSLEHRLVRPDGEVRWVHVKSQTHFEGAGDARRAVRVVGAMIDITERKRGEQALHTSEERFRLAADAMRGMVYDWDATTGRVYRSAGMLGLIGYAPDEAPASSAFWTERMNPEDLGVADRAFEEAVAARAHAAVVEYRVRHRDGHDVWVWDQARLVYGDDGRLQRVVGFAVSIDDTKRSEVRARFLAQLHPILIGERDPVSLVHQVLQALAEHLAVELVAMGELSTDGAWITVQQEYLDGRPSVLGTHRAASYLDDVARAAVLGGEGMAIEDVARDPRTAAHEESFRQLEIAAVLIEPLLGADGPRAVITLNSRVPRAWRPEEGQLLRDVAARLFPAIERARAEASLRASERRLALALETSTAGAWELDLSTGSAILDERVPALLGLPIGEATEAVRRWPELVHEDDRAAVMAAFTRACDVGGPAYDVDARLRLGDGSLRWFGSRGVVVEERGVRRMLGVLQDITARKLAEQALVDADRRKNEYLAMLGHELRNPLAAIRTATEIVKQVTADDPRVVRAHAVLERQSLHMTRLVDGLLEVSRIAAGKIALHREIVDLRDIVEAVVRDRAPQLAAAGLALGLDVGRDPLHVSGDQIRLAQIVDNLLANAIKFTDPGGTITVTTLAEGGAAVLRVRDTGIGIRPEVMGHIFEPFQQDPRDIARADGGLGLGLALAKGLVALHAGMIEAQSPGLGAGAELTVRLPRSAAPAITRPAPRRIGAAPTRVLVVEDNADVSQMLCDALEPNGHVVFVAANALAAIAILEREAIEVVLCDIGLPGMSGYDLAQRIRADPALRELTLFAMTGYGLPEDQERARAAGFDGHLTKPMDVLVLDEVLARRRGPPSPS